MFFGDFNTGADIFAELHGVTIRDTVSFHRVHGQFDETGSPKHLEEVNKATATMLNQLAWWAAALRQARATNPFTVVA